MSKKSPRRRRLANSVSPGLLHQGGGLVAALIFLLGLYAPVLRAQEQATQPPTETQETFHIVDIRIEGNKKTKPQVILREMKTRPGQTVTLEQLELDRRRIASLGLFNRVQLKAEPHDEGIILIVDVSEQWYIFPLPVFFFNDREYKLKKLTYGAALVHTNFRGRAELLQIAALLGFNPSFSINYSNPWIFGDARLFFSARFFVARIRNKSSEIRDTKIDENRLGGGITLGKRFTLHTSLYLSLSYRRLSLSEADSILTLHPSGRDHLPQASLALVLDHRDYVFYPVRGYFARFEWQKTGIPGNDFIDYSRFSMDLRKYFPLGKATTFALGFAGDFSHGRIPAYDRVFYGFFDRIRGYFKRRMEGEHKMQAGAEFRFPITPITYYNLDNDKLGRYGQDLKFGIAGSLFFDIATLWLQDRPGRSDLGNFTTGPFGPQTRPGKWVFGYGVGLNFHLPYIQLARLEFALNDLGEKELIFDAGVKF